MSCPAKDWLEFFVIFYSSIYLLSAQFGWRKPGYVLSPYSRLSGCDDLFVLLLKSTFLATAYWPPNTIYRVSSSGNRRNDRQDTRHQRQYWPAHRLLLSLSICLGNGTCGCRDCRPRLRINISDAAAGNINVLFAALHRVLCTNVT